MKIIKKIILAIVMLFSLVACSGATVNFSGSAAPVKPSQKHVLIAAYPKSDGDWEAYIGMPLNLKGWKISYIIFWEVENINFKKRSETFLIVVDKMKKSGEGFFGGPEFKGNIKVYDLRTGTKIIDYSPYHESDSAISFGIANALGKLVEK